MNKTIDTPEFWTLMWDWHKVAGGVYADEPKAALIAHIDAHVAAQVAAHIQDWSIADPSGAVDRLRRAAQRLLDAASKSVGFHDNDEIAQATKEIDDALAGCVGYPGSSQPQPAPVVDDYRAKMVVIPCVSISEHKRDALLELANRIEEAQGKPIPISCGAALAIRMIVQPQPAPVAAMTDEQKETGQVYGIIDPDYGRIYTMVRKLAWEEGYAIGLHGSFTRDLDMIAVPWADHNPGKPEKLIARIVQATGLREAHGNPGSKPHGRKVWTLLLPEFGDPRFVDLSIMPVVQPNPVFTDEQKSDIVGAAKLKTNAWEESESEHREISLLEYEAYFFDQIIAAQQEAV